MVLFLVGRNVQEDVQSQVFMGDISGLPVSCCCRPCVLTGPHSGALPRWLGQTRQVCKQAPGAQAQSFESASAALDSAKETLKAQNAREAELHFGLQLFRLPAQHNTDLAACERVSTWMLQRASS